MSDWLKRITSIISSSDDASDSALTVSTLPPPALFKLQTKLADKPSEAENKKEDIPVKDENVRDHDDNLEILKKLRDQPRGTNLDSRIAGVQALLGEKEIFKTLKMLRWPQGVICPRCHSSNIVRRDPPFDATDQRHYYECLNCKGDGGISEFDDFTGLPVESLHSLRQWILCWYLIGFCSVAQISKVLGVSINEVLQMAAIGSDLTMLKTDPSHQKEKTARHEKDKQGQEHNEELTRSASKSPLKPGYKSKK